MTLWLVRSAIAALYPRTPTLPGADDCGLDGFLRQYRREAPALMWLGVVLGALLFHLTPLFTVGVPLPALLLPGRLLDTHAARITVVRPYLLRQALFVLKLCAGLAWGKDPEVRRRLGLPPLPPDPGTWRTS